MGVQPSSARALRSGQLLRHITGDPVGRMPAGYALARQRGFECVVASRGDSFPFGRPMRANEGSETEIIRPFTFPPHSKIRARHGLLMP